MSPTCHANGIVQHRFLDGVWTDERAQDSPSRERVGGLGDVGINPTENATMGEIIAARFSRRDLLRGSLAVAAISATVGTNALAANEQPAKKGCSRLI
jgi:hypothetical protein